jgi:putative RecB family exonuclease
LNKGKALLAVFHQEVPKENCRVLGIEQPFAFGLEGLPVPIIGVFDLVIEDEAGVVTIVDHKTCAKAYSDREIDDSFQLTVYHMAAKADGHANRDVLLRFDCLVKTKTPKFIQYYTTKGGSRFHGCTAQNPGGLGWHPEGRLYPQ